MKLGPLTTTSIGSFGQQADLLSYRYCSHTNPMVPLFFASVSLSCPNCDSFPR
jgi:hypothetical protein